MLQCNFLGGTCTSTTGMRSTKSSGSNSHAVRKGYTRGGKAFTQITDLVQTLMGILIVCFLCNISNMAINVSNNVP